MMLNYRGRHSSDHSSLSACGNKSDEFVTIMSRPKLGFLSSSHAHKQEAPLWDFILIRCPDWLDWLTRTNQSVALCGGNVRQGRLMATKCLMFHYKCHIRHHQANGAPQVKTSLQYCNISSQLQS